MGCHDHVIVHRRPDLVIIQKETNTCQVIGFAIPYDTRVNTKEIENVIKYRDLLWEIKYVNEKYLRCYKNIEYNTFDAEEKVIGNTCCHQNWRTAENNITAYNKNPPKFS